LKFELRSTKSETNPKFECHRLETIADAPAVRRGLASEVWDIWILSFEFVSDFGFEISDFGCGLAAL
jgi:hypothetical protein